MPRDAPPAIPLLPSSRWQTASSYWAEPWSDTTGMLEKYRAMSEALAVRGIERSDRLRALARQWPGSLREAQITSPDRYLRRSEALATLGARTRADWRAAGHGAIPLWADLHELLGDIARMRNAAPDPFAVLEPLRRRCWPDVPRNWPAWVIRRFDTRLARAWLCSLAGLDPTQLDAMLRGE